MDLKQMIDVPEREAEAGRLVRRIDSGVSDAGSLDVHQTCHRI